MARRLKNNFFSTGHQKKRYTLENVTESGKNDPQSLGIFFPSGLNNNLFRSLSYNTFSFHYSSLSACSFTQIRFLNV